MLAVGKRNSLRVVKQVDFGFYLDDQETTEEILIPSRYVPKDCQVNDILDVFIYYDSEDRLIATTEEPYAQVGSCAYLKVVDKGSIGAFMDWGLPKDLLVPFKEQRVPMQVGKYYTVFIYLDKTGRIAASSRLSLHLQEENNDYFTEGEAVNIHVASRSDIGYKAVINGTHLGIIHNSDILQPIRVGDSFTAYIKNIREDERINLMLQPKGEDLRDPLAQEILTYIKAQGNSTTLTDKSTPEEIYSIFKVSKSNYKKALGSLYKQNLILIEKERVILL
jgi:hypothetical protein